MKPYISGKLSVHEVLSYLEPFMIYHKDLSFMQYQEITEFIKGKITDFKKNYISMSRKFATINAKANKSSKNLNSYLNDLFILNEPIRKEVLVDYYGFASPIPDISISEFMKKIESIDNGRFFYATLTVLNLQLISPVSTDAVIEDMKSYIEEANEDLTNPRINTCNQYKNIAKRYVAIDELEDDNFIDIFFDKKYDTTFYSIYNDEYKDKLASSLADQEDKLTAILIKKNGLTKENAQREAKAMIMGKRLVENGDFAVLDMLDQGNPEMIYYIRENNEWKLMPEDGSNIPIVDDKSKSICNFQYRYVETFTNP